MSEPETLGRLDLAAGGSLCLEQRRDPSGMRMRLVHRDARGWQVAAVSLRLADLRGLEQLARDAGAACGRHSS